MVTFKNLKSGQTFKVKDEDAAKFDRSGYYAREPEKATKKDDEPESDGA